MSNSSHKRTFPLFVTAFEHDNLLSEAYYLYSHNKRDNNALDAGKLCIALNITLSPYITFAVLKSVLTSFIIEKWTP